MEVERRALLRAACLGAAGAATLGRTARARAAAAQGIVPLNQSRQVGFTLSHEQFPVSWLVELGRAAEQAGFSLISTSDHFQPWQPNEGHAGLAWVMLAALGQRTERIRMGTAVTCPSFRYEPAIVAQAFATLGLLYPDRMYLGVGSGEALNEAAASGRWASWAERSDRLVEATGVIRQLWTGAPVKEHGKYFTVDGRLYDVPAPPVPILMAANGPKAMRRAGQYADGVITDAKTWQRSRSEFENAARSAGKDPARMPVVVEHFVVVGDQREAEAAANTWRFLPKAWKPYFEITDPAVIENRARAEVALEDVHRDWPIGTDPDIHLHALTKLFEAGVTTVLVHSGQADQMRVIDFYGTRVLPGLAKKASSQ